MAIVLLVSCTQHMRFWHKRYWRFQCTGRVGVGAMERVNTGDLVYQRPNVWSQLPVFNKRIHVFDIIDILHCLSGNSYFILQGYFNKCVGNKSTFPVILQNTFLQSTDSLYTPSSFHHNFNTSPDEFRDHILDRRLLIHVGSPLLPLPTATYTGPGAYNYILVPALITIYSTGIGLHDLYSSYKLI